MRKTARFWAVAGLAAFGVAGMALGQTVTLRSSYPVEAPVALKVFENSTKCLPGRGGPGADPNAALVEIRAVRWPYTKPVAVSTNGESNEAANPLVRATRIGAGVSGDRPGRFSVCVPKWALDKADKSGTPSRDMYNGFFARVYDGPTVEQSKYYIDSEVAEYNPNQLFTNLVFASRSMTPISGDDDWANGDDDGDGLSNGREQWDLYTDPYNPDTDGDGLSDYDECRAGLDPLSPYDLSITAITKDRTEAAVTAGVSEEALHVEWPIDNTNLLYTLQFVPFMDKWPENGGDDEWLFEIPVGVSPAEKTPDAWAADISPYVTDTNFQSGFFRVKVKVKPESDASGAESDE